MAAARVALPVAGIAWFFAVSAGAEDWRRIAPGGGGFAIEMPGAPERKVLDRFTPLGSVRETKYWLRVDGAELSVETHDVPHIASALMSDASLLDRARDGVIENEAGTTLATRDLRFQGAPARAFTFRYPGEPTRTERALAVLVGRRIYLLTGTGTDPAGHPAVNRFFESFRLEAAHPPSEQGERRP